MLEITNLPTTEIEENKRYFVFLSEWFEVTNPSCFNFVCYVVEKSRSRIKTLSEEKDNIKH